MTMTLIKASGQFVHGRGRERRVRQKSRLTRVLTTLTVHGVDIALQAQDDEMDTRVLAVRLLTRTSLPSVATIAILMMNLQLATRPQRTHRSW